MATEADNLPQQLYKQLFENGKFYEAQQLFMTQVTRKNSVPLAFEAIIAFLGSSSENKIELAASMGSHMIDIANKRVAALQNGEPLVADESKMVDVSTTAIEEEAKKSLDIIIKACEAFPTTALKSSTSTNTKQFFTQAIEFSIQHAENNSPHGHKDIHAALALQYNEAKLYPEAQFSWACSGKCDEHIAASLDALSSFDEPTDSKNEGDDMTDVAEVSTEDATINEKSRFVIAAVLSYLSIEDLKGANDFFDCISESVEGITANTLTFLRCALKTAEYNKAQPWTNLVNTFTPTLLTEKPDTKTEKKKWKLEELAAAVGVALWNIAPPKDMLDSILDAASMFQGFDMQSMLKGFGMGQ